MRLSAGFRTIGTQCDTAPQRWLRRRYKRPRRKRKAVTIDPIPASCSSGAWQADKKLLADLIVLQKHRSGVLNPGADMRIYDNR
jgi:hypothetical protein